MNSPFFKLNLKDLGKSLLVFFLTTFVGAIATTIYAGALPTLIELKAALMLGATGGVGYLIKNLLSGTSDDYSDFFKLNWRDIGKAVLMLFITSVLTTITEVIGTGSLPTLSQIKTALLSGLIVSIGYIIKNVFTNSDGEALKKE